MKIVLYDGMTGEPITVTNIIDWHRLDIPEGEPINVPVPPEVTPWRERADGPEVPTMAFSVVRIYFAEIRFNYGKVRSWIAYTMDADTALKLRAAFLPGQSKALQERYERAFGDGISAALGLMGRYR